jgi:two-component sensor histidine kinase
MLADGGWTGAALDRILSEELVVLTRAMRSASQVSVAGCKVLLNTPAAQNFSLIIHELATNAVKHGALSCPDGQVAIEGSIAANKDGGVFRFTWKESGPRHVTPPQHQGFGNSILNGLAKRFAQTVEATYRREGLIYELQIPLRSIQALEANRLARHSAYA